MTSFSDKQWLYEDTTIEDLDRPEQVLGTVEVYRCTIRAARLGGATLRRWVFEDCRFEDCDLSNAVLRGCVFQRCVFEGCRLVGSDWRGLSTMTASLTCKSCALTYGVFEGVGLSQLQCIDSDCSEADFTEANLRGAAFPETRLEGAIFARTCLEDADLSRALGDEVDPLQNDVEGVRFSVQAAIRLAARWGIKVPV